MLKGNLPLSLHLQVLADFSGLVLEHVLQLLLLLSEHLHVSLAELNLLVNSSDELLKPIELGLEARLLSHGVGASWLSSEAKLLTVLHQ